MGLRIRLGLGSGLGLGPGLSLGVRLRVLTEGIDELDMRQSAAQEAGRLGTGAREAWQGL